MEEKYKEKLEMKIKKIALVVVMMANIFFCLLINFSEILSGVSIGSKNIIVSIVYLVVWILIILLSSYLKSKKLLKLFLGYWILNLVLYFFVTLLLKFEIYISILVLLVVVFIGPMQGIYLSNSLVIISIIGVLMSIFIAYFIRKTP
ncbi:hypothetical protein H9660_04805 [Clostridium sp. Sa3CUN1]|uniref:Uncharacterized protein n=1 Tax=Clostridium gallinarum TaxID=2762246 RepID=A0ABR8Q211_9CLOT|nr:hypothetical protein [Clostridium gallinarum]MBD7914458.1 hypothetical protein [Clostridium gallinarum]